MKVKYTLNNAMMGGKFRSLPQDYLVSKTRIDPYHTEVVFDFVNQRQLDNVNRMLFGGYSKGRYEILDESLGRQTKISENYNLNTEVKNFNCFGEGWLFDDMENELDLSKFEWNKGYTLDIPHFGVIDPLFGDPSSDSPWESDKEFIKYVLEANGLVDAWLGSDIISSLAEELEIESSKENLDLLIEVGIDRDADHYIRDTLNSLKFGEGFALCGITNKEYFTDLVSELFGHLGDSSEINVVFLG